MASQPQHTNSPEAPRPSTAAATSVPAGGPAVATVSADVPDRSHGATMNDHIPVSLTDLTDLGRQQPSESAVTVTEDTLGAKDDVGSDELAVRLGDNAASASFASREDGIEIHEAFSVVVKASWTSDRTPLWNEAIVKWTETDKGKEECAELEKLVDDTLGGIESPEFLAQLQPSVRNSSKWRLRLKRCEPILNATRGVAITLANADPHKIAPLVVHSVFAGINILFNRMSPENTEKVLDILFGCSDTIRECVSFEKNFIQKEHPAVQDEMATIRKALPDLYLQALQLIHEVQTSCSHVKHKYATKKDAVIDWAKIRGMKVSNM